MPAAFFAEWLSRPCVSTVREPMGHGDDFLAEGRSEALLQVDEYLRNKFQINLASLTGPGHENLIEFLKRVITYGIDGWTCTGHPAHSKKLVDELNLGGAKDAATPDSTATGVNDPHSEDNLTPEKAEKYRITRGKVAPSLSGRSACAIRHRSGDSRHEWHDCTEQCAILLKLLVWMDCFVGRVVARHCNITAWQTLITHPTRRADAA